MNHSINLLWTGGWDSTFRLLDLVLMHRKMVQPYYLVSSERKSSKIEVETMDKIRSQLYQQAPEAKQLLLPTIYHEVNAIQPNETITNEFSCLKAAAFLGSQYEYLARFARETGIEHLELSVHKDDHAQRFLAPYVIEENNNYRLKEHHGQPGLDLFRYFRFPILQLTKRDMEAFAKKHGFLTLLNQTVFCHTPLPNGKPCGYCNPCRYTMQEGLARRLPLIPRVKFYIKRLIKK